MKLLSDFLPFPCSAILSPVKARVLAHGGFEGSSEHPPVAFANSDSLEVGDYVLAIGNPFGLGQTVTSGIVSGLRRTEMGLERYEDFIQTDASINPGNSGGALVNLRGELVGINAAIVGNGSGNAGIGFAISINMVRAVADQLVK